MANQQNGHGGGFSRAWPEVSHRFRILVLGGSSRAPRQTTKFRAVLLLRRKQSELLRRNASLALLRGSRRVCVPSTLLIALPMSSRADWITSAKRMATCCANNSAQFRPDCYSWCNVDLPSGLPGFDPVILELRRFSMCLQEGEDVHYTPRMLCMNGTKNDAPSPSTSAPAGPTSTSSAMGWKDLGKSTWVVLGLILLQTALEQCF